MNGQQIHIVSPEFAPQLGGVADHSAHLATGLAERGADVHVWTRCGATPVYHSFQVHTTLGTFSQADLASTTRALRGSRQGSSLFVQWVPHGYGCKSLNLAFCWWVWRQAKVFGHPVELIVHEPFLMFGEGSRKQDVAAFVHRVMMMTLLQAASRVWITIPAWASKLKPWMLGRSLPVEWLPVPSNIPVNCEARWPARLQQPRLPAGGQLIGHFGTFGSQQRTLLSEIIPVMLSDAKLSMLLIGRGSEQFQAEMLDANPHLRGRLAATGSVSRDETSSCLRRCDLMIQPFTDGVSSRRSSVMAALAHGVPVITSLGVATEDIWKTSKAVRMAPAHDTKQFAAAALTLVHDEAACLQLQENASLLYQREFAIGRMLDRITTPAIEFRRTSCA